MSHSDAVLVGLNVLRRDNTFTDVRIKVEETEFPVHKCVLSAFSPYFKAMFTAGLVETDQVDGFASLNKQHHSCL